MGKDVIRKEESVPGIGLAGVVMCPFGFQRGPCLKGGCEMWVELSYGPQKVGRCSIAWTAIILPELRASIDKLALKKE
jgi:hypothetical protein